MGGLGRGWDETRIDVQYSRAPTAPSRSVGLGSATGINSARDHYATELLPSRDATYDAPAAATVAVPVADGTRIGVVNTS